MPFSLRYPERRWAMQSDEMLQQLGITNGKLPKEGMDMRRVNGVAVYVLPQAPPANGRKSSKHRVMAVCPVCQKHMSAGRLISQHYRRMHPEAR